MSKSLGNVLLVHNLVESIPGEVIRLALLSAHYRQPLDWSDEGVANARNKLDRLYGAVRGISVPDGARAAAEPLDSVVAALENDLNTPEAMAEFFGLARTLNKVKEEEGAEAVKLAARMYATGDLLGLLQSDPEEWFAGPIEGQLAPADIEAMIEKRNIARKQKDFAAADAIRDELADAGIQIEDGPSGTSWRRV